MSTEYLERVQESKSFTDRLLPLAPAVISLELVAEAGRLIAAEQRDSWREPLEQNFHLICDPEAREEAERQRREDQLSAELEDFLEGVSVSSAETEAAEGEEVDYMEILGREEAKQELAEHRRVLSQEETQYTMARIERTVSEAEFGISFGENRYGHPWHGFDSLEAVEEVMRLQKKLGMTIAGDRIRQLLVDGGVGELHQRGTVRLLLLNAEEANDRQSFVAAAERFTTLAEGRWPQDAEPYALPLVKLATKFIKDSESGELDREALDIALRALPYYDPVRGSYPLLLARLGVALRRFGE